MLAIIKENKKLCKITRKSYRYLIYIYKIVFFESIIAILYNSEVFIFFYYGREI